MPVYEKLAGSTNDTVLKATGKTWNEWVTLIDNNGGNSKTHKEIAKELINNYQVPSWWSQQLTVGYEQAKGERVLGQTKDAGFEIGVSKTLDFSSQKVWDFMMSKTGLNIWLGEIDSLKLEPKFQYLTKEKTGGQVRTFAEGKMIRLTYQPKGWQKHSTLQLRTTAQGDRTILGFHQENLKDGKTREQMKKHWQQVVDKVEQALKG